VHAKSYVTTKCERQRLLYLGIWNINILWLSEELKILLFPSIKGDLDTWCKSVLGIPPANWPRRIDGNAH
jgi:hypothetical protein